MGDDAGNSLIYGLYFEIDPSFSFSSNTFIMSNPTKTSQLINDSNFVTYAEFEWDGSSEGTVTSEKFEELRNANIVIVKQQDGDIIAHASKTSGGAVMFYYSATINNVIESAMFIVMDHDCSWTCSTSQTTIPAAVTAATVSGWGFTKNAGTYNKPSGGIPKTDLASSVQTSLGKADSAIQSIKTINNQSLIGSGNVTINTNPHYIVTSFTINSLDEYIAQGVTEDITFTDLQYVQWAFEDKKPVYVRHDNDDYNAFMYQMTGSFDGDQWYFYISIANSIYRLEVYDKKTIGYLSVTRLPESFKTINGESIIGSGDITISGGSIDTSNLATKDELAQKQDVISDIDTIRNNAANYKGTVTSVKIDGVSKTPSSGVVDLGYVNKQLSTSTSSSMTLSPNIYYRNTSTSLSTLTITLGSVSNSNILNEYFVEFTTRDAGTTVSLPNSIKWANGVAPTFENGKTYQISIVNNLGTCVKFG